MSITKKINKKMLGGSARTTLNKDANSINQDFADSFKYYFQELKVRMDYNVSDEEDLIFIGLIDKDTLFGTTVKQSTGGIVKYIHLKTALYINFKDDNVKRINQFKLYIMSIMANYPLQGGNSLYTKITPLLNPLKISEIMKILDIPEDIKASLPVKPPPLQNYDLLTLNIYREFGVKCTLDGGECHGKIKDDFINKIGDIDIKLWSSWLSSDIEPLVALAIPGVVNKDEIWSELATRGILLDRLRLVESCSDTPPQTAYDNIDYLRKLVDEMSELVH